jgi:hypothetical protein
MDSTLYEWEHIPSDKAIADAEEAGRLGGRIVKCLEISGSVIVEVLTINGIIYESL